MKKNRKKYDAAFKLEAIRLVSEEGRKVSEVECNLDISRGTLARWVREQKADPVHAFPGKGGLKAKSEEIRRLRTELKRTQEEGGATSFINDKRSNDVLTKGLAVLEESKHRKTLSLVEELAPYWNEPTKLNTLSVPDLRNLSGKKALTIFNLEYFQSIVLQANKEGNSLYSLPTADYYERTINCLQELDRTIQKQIDNRLRIKEWFFVSSVLTAHLVILVWLIHTNKSFFLPLYLVLGTGVFYMLAKDLGKRLISQKKSYLSILPRPIGLISIPATSVLLIGTLFVTPEILSMKDTQLAKITQSTKLDVGCGSGVTFGELLSAGEEVLVQGSQGDCFLVETSKGSMGYVYRKSLSILKATFLGQLRKQTIALIISLALIATVCWFGYWWYMKYFVPYYLKRKVSRSTGFLHEQMDNAQLFKGILVEGGILSDLDIQDAKSQLIVKVTKRFHEQALRIINSPSLRRSEKNKMIKELTELTSGALRDTN